MHHKLLLFLSNIRNRNNAVVAPSLAWLASEKEFLFDSYFDSYHQGIHFPGGDWRLIDEGGLTGGTVTGDRHFAEFCHLLLNFDVSVVSLGQTMFSSTVNHFNVPVAANSENIHILYNKLFTYLNLDLPANVVMIGSYETRHLPGIENYLYPEIYFRKAIGVPESLSNDQLEALGKDAEIFCCFVSPSRIEQLREKGFKLVIVETCQKNDDYVSVTKRIALRWREHVKGWIIGDPPLILHWLPTACRESLISIYGTPQKKALKDLESLLTSYGNIVYGRQYEDSDFFDLSKMKCGLQVIDPCRPPFQSIKYIQYYWQHREEGFYSPEYSPEELERFAREGCIFVSLAFWTGMIRELANLYNLMDLIAITKMKCGLVLTAASFEYMMHQPMELMTVPIDQGGIYPLTEPMLGSCGTGVAIESYVDHKRLQAYLDEAMQRIQDRVGSQDYLPRGWWTTMDTSLEKRSFGKRPKPISFRSYPPYLQFRYHKKEKIVDKGFHVPNKIAKQGRPNTKAEFIKDRMRKWNLESFFSPYRPYEFFGAGNFNPEMAAAAKSSGLRYMFTKAGFGLPPKNMHLDDHFIALNYTAGQWDGWTPFETVNHVADLEKAEKRLLRGGEPGWLVGTIDSCLWTFGGEMWRRGSQLFQIAQFCAKGGKSGKLINVRPNTIAEYARIVAGMK